MVKKGTWPVARRGATWLHWHCLKSRTWMMLPACLWLGWSESLGDGQAQGPPGEESLHHLHSPWPPAFPTTHKKALRRVT